jgi:hypothetical protein
LPDWNRCSLALLKQAYLAACLTFGVPEGEMADETRHDLGPPGTPRTGGEYP